MNGPSHSTITFAANGAVVLGVVLVGRWKRTCSATLVP
jgi:hypothetical protein